MRGKVAWTLELDFLLHHSLASCVALDKVLKFYSYLPEIVANSNIYLTALL